MNLVRALAVLLLVVQAPRAPEAIRWARSWDEGVQEASFRNVPIYFTVHKDG